MEPDTNPSYLLTQEKNNIYRTMIEKNINSQSKHRSGYKFQVNDVDGKNINSDPSRQIDKVRSCDKIYGIIKENDPTKSSTTYKDELKKLHFSLEKGIWNLWHVIV